jgi:cytochrome P450
VREYDVLSEAFCADPYPALAQMRRSDPCWFDPRLNAFVITRYADIRRVLYDHDDFSSERVAQFVNGAPPHLKDKVDAYVSDFAYPVPTRVLARVLGISDADIEQFKAWTTEVFTLIGAGVSCAARTVRWSLPARSSGQAPSFSAS